MGRPTDSIEIVTFYNCLIVFMKAYEGETWEGTASTLLEQLHPYREQCAPHGRLPSNAQSVSVILHRHLTHVGETYLAISYKRIGKDRSRIISISKEPKFQTYKHVLIHF